MSGGVVSDVNKLVGSIERFWDTILWDVLPTIITIISVTIALSFIFWQFAIAIVLLSTIVIGIIVWSQTKIMPISNELAERSSQRTAYLSDVISNISAVKAFAQEKHEMKHFKKIVDDWRDADIREMKGVIVVTAVFSATMSILNVSAFIAAIFAMQYHLGNVGMIYLIITYTLNVSKQVWDVAGSTRSFIRIVGDAGPMIETLDSEPELKDPKFPQPSKINDGKIEFIDVDFTHDNNDDSLFNKFTLCIKPGEKIGLVGSSGSGKTSLTRLLLRFSDVDSGKILIDGQDIRDITQKDLHRCIAYVPQEPVLFHRTLQENIAYGKPKASLAEIKEAAKQANALDFIEVLKDKFETLVGERGIKLSGGQRQRIAIARAILKDAPILVLDEATSALDSETEALIQQALEKLMRNRTSIVIAHRLSTIAKLDRIVVMEEGKIIEQGSHEELIDKKGIYASLWSRQSGGFIKD
jgi:ATP-binding cassette subfamily B protein